MTDSEPNKRWYDNGLVLFVGFVGVAGILGFFAHERNSDRPSYSASTPRVPNIDNECLKTIDDDTALLFDRNIELGRFKACDRSLDDIELPPEMEAKIDEVLANNGTK